MCGEGKRHFRSRRGECIEKIKMDTRRYAKRQLTWFRRNKSVNWIDVQDKSAAEIFDEAKKLIESSSLFKLMHP